MTQGRFGRFGTSEKYKTHLNAIFDGKVRMVKPSENIVLPFHAGKRVVKTFSPTDALIRKLEDSHTPSDISVAAGAFKDAGFDFPQIEDALAKILLADQEALALEAAQNLEQLLKKQKPKNLRLLKSRLESALLTAGTPLLSWIQKLQSMV